MPGKTSTAEQFAYVGKYEIRWLTCNAKTTPEKRRIHEIVKNCETTIAIGKNTIIEFTCNLKADERIGMAGDARDRVLGQLFTGKLSATDHPDCYPPPSQSVILQVEATDRNFTEGLDNQGKTVRCLVESPSLSLQKMHRSDV